MSKKSDHASQLLAKIKPRYPLPEPLPEATLLEQGLCAILRRTLDKNAAHAGVVALRKAYTDINEVRVSQAQEIAGHLRGGAKALQAARDVKTFLQEVFQETHGLDLEFLRTEPADAAKFLSHAKFLGLSQGSWLLGLATGELPIVPGLMRVLDRLGLAGRVQSAKKARAAIEPMIKKGGGLEFAIRFAEVADRWCDAKKPICHECVLVEQCKFGKKTYRDWKVQQERLEAQRKREDARREALEKKEAVRRAREEERERKRLAAEKKKAERETARRNASFEKARNRASAKKEREELAKKRAEEKRRAAEAQRKSAAKKSAAKQAAGKKAAAAKKAAAKKKTTSKRTAKKTTAKKKPAPRKSSAKKKVTKKKSSSKAAKKKVTKKSTTRTSTKKKPAAKRGAARRRTKKA